MRADLIGEELSKKLEALPSNVKRFLAGIPEHNTNKYASSTKSFSTGSSKSTPKQYPKKNKPSLSNLSLIQTNLNCKKPLNMGLQLHLLII